MTHHVQFQPHLPRGKIGGEQHPVDAAERPVLGRQFQGLNTMRSQSYSAFCGKLCLGMAAALFSLENGPPPRSVLDVIRRDGVPYPYGEIEHDVIAALIRPPLDPWQEG